MSRVYPHSNDSAIREEEKSYSTTVRYGDVLYYVRSCYAMLCYTTLHYTVLFCTVMFSEMTGERNDEIQPN